MFLSEDSAMSLHTWTRSQVGGEDSVDHVNVWRDKGWSPSGKTKPAGDTKADDRRVWYPGIGWSPEDVVMPDVESLRHLLLFQLCFNPRRTLCSTLAPIK